MTEARSVDCGDGVRLERGVRCRLRDGVELVSDHYHPPGPGPHPTLLMRQPYGRDIASTVVYAHPVWFARHGYNVVIQDVRGRGDSAGEFYPFRNEGRDGAETIAWLRTRAESNGRIGMYGFSYQGMTQLLAAAEGPEGLVCISPAMTAHDLYHGWFYHQGALRLAASLGWGLQLLKADTRRLRLREASDRLEEAWATAPAQTSFLPFREHPALAGEGVPQYVLDWFDHSEPGEYWTSLDLSQSLERIRVPALHFSGWYDTYLSGTIDGFRALSEGAGSTMAREHQYLVAGPWVHIPWGDRIGAAGFGAEALLDTDTILLRWFDHWLKDSGQFSAEPRIRHFVLGANRWREAEVWPRRADHPLYLHSAGRANSRKGDGVLSAAPPARDEPSDVFVYDPEVPVLAPGGQAASAGQFDQAALELGNNLLVYTTEPLEQPLGIFGTPRASLYCSTSSAHADFTAKLVRVRPSGAAEFISIGIARSSWLFRLIGYSADTVHHWEFDLEPTSCCFTKGDRVRIEISSSAFPLYDRNPGTKIPPCRATSGDWKRSTQFVYHDGKHPAALYLPVSESAE
ncbi:MAG TPA: CocE/NonD family hydrolase [Verrucomicrobiae bacterium]|jgi:putative CocE/NonD family hydrolase|nr:CocE/NonD family hydrolase [Verrucomicrobiae bacterium]